MRVLVAPDSCKGTLTAAQVAAAIADGVEAAGDHAVRCPPADGGEGTLAVLAAAIAAAGGLGFVELELLCDVTTPYQDAAVRFACRQGVPAHAVVGSLDPRGVDEAAFASVTVASTRNELAGARRVIA
jgi:hypothetical protein